MRPGVVRVVFFDAGGTLIRTRLSVGEIYARRARDFGARADPEQLEQGFRRAFADAPPLAFPGVPPAELLAHEQGWWRDIVRRAFPADAFPPGAFEPCFQALFEDFARPAAWEVFADVVPTLRALQARGLRLGVISNFDARLLPLFEGLGLSRLFDTLTFSSGAGAAKPDARIFQHALALHGARPEEALHVGDSAREDVEGALAAGLRALRVRGEGPGLEAVLDALP